MSYSERLWRASAKGDLKTVQSMVYGENSDVNMSNTAHGFTGRSLIHMAIANGHTDIALFLIHQPGIDIEACDIVEETPFLKACLYNRLDVVEELVKKGSNLNAINNNGDTGLHIAVSSMNAELVKYILSLKEGDVHTIQILKNSDEKTAIDIAKEKNMFYLFEKPIAPTPHR